MPSQDTAGWMRSLHSDFPAFIWLQLTPYDTHCCLSDWRFQGMTLIPIAGTWCIFCVVWVQHGQPPCFAELLGSSGGLQAVFLIPHPLRSSQQLASCPFWMGVPIPTPFPHGVRVLPASSSCSSSMSSAAQAALSFCSRPSLECCLAREWMLMGGTETLCRAWRGSVCVPVLGTVLWTAWQE